jgi:hypothetical protein
MHAQLRAFLLVGALGLAGAQSSALAAVAPFCPDGPFAGQQSSIVTSGTEEISPGVWQYTFRVCNMSDREGGDLIRDWELPYFRDAGINNIQTPFGWAFNIEAVGTPNDATGWDGTAQWQQDGDPWKAIFDAAYGGAALNPYNTNTEVLHFYLDQLPTFAALAIEVDESCGFIFPGEGCNSFGFTSTFGPTDAPYQASWVANPPRTGDPSFPGSGLPNSPSVQRQIIPEPTGLALLAAGLPALFAIRRRSRT